MKIAVLSVYILIKCMLHPPAKIKCLIRLLIPMRWLIRVVRILLGISDDTNYLEWD